MSNPYVASTICIRFNGWAAFIDFRYGYFRSVRANFFSRPNFSPGFLWSVAFFVKIRRSCKRKKNLNFLTRFIFLLKIFTYAWCFRSWCKLGIFALAIFEFRKDFLLQSKKRKIKFKRLSLQQPPRFITSENKGAIYLF